MVSLAIHGRNTLYFGSFLIKDSCGLHGVAADSEDGSLHVDRLPAGPAEAEVDRLQGQQHRPTMGVVCLPYDRPHGVRHWRTLH